MTQLGIASASPEADGEASVISTHVVPISTAAITPSILSVSLFNNTGHKMSKSSKDFLLLLYDRTFPLKISVLH